MTTLSSIALLVAPAALAALGIVMEAVGAWTALALIGAALGVCAAVALLNPGLRDLDRPSPNTEQRTCNGTTAHP